MSLQPPKATKNFVFRELQGIYALFIKARKVIYSEGNSFSKFSRAFLD
jgi:hypothetical protein